jgi:hypothetical protein
MKPWSPFTFFLLGGVILFQVARAQYTGTRIISQDGYDACVELSNASTRVVLDPNLGGRVLRYELHGKNILHEDPSKNGKLHEPGTEFGHPPAGRIDIGPQWISPKRPALFLGAWEARITDHRQAVMTSMQDTSTGVQLTRYFTLDAESSHLQIRQVIRNVSDDTVRYCYWGRSFAKGGGISLTPLNPHSRYPRGYLVHGPGLVMDFMPADEEHVRIRDGILEILGPPARPKFGMDSYPGWLAYISQDHLLFVKKFPVYSHRVYGEMAGYTTSIWYNKEEMVEIEPLGPLEIMAPGTSSEFTVDWHLMEYTYPEDRQADLDQIRALIGVLTQSVNP